MALTSVTTGTTAAIGDVNQYKVALEGGSGGEVAYHLKVASGENILITLADASGAKKLSVRDSAAAELLALDSNGILSLGTGGVDINTAAGLLKHEAGGLEFNASAITTGGLIRGASSGVMSLLTVGSAGDVLTVSGGAPAWVAPTAPPLFVEKTANQTVNNSTTLVSDTHLKFTMVANKRYAVWGCILMITPNTAEFDFKWLLPGSCTIDGSYDLSPVNDGGVFDFTENAEFAIQSDGSLQGASWSGVIVADGSGGVAQYQWAQNSAVAGNTTLYAGSWFSYKLLN